VAATPNTPGPTIRYGAADGQNQTSASLNPAFCRIDPYPAAPLSWPPMRGLIALMLVVTLTGFGPRAWANPEDALPHPTVRVPFDEKDKPRYRRR
jgi:hypothetical protein